MNYSDFCPITQTVLDYPNRIKLPPVGVRMHRVFLNNRPNAIQMYAKSSPVIPGPAVPDDRAEPESPVAWALLSLVMALLVVCGAFIFTGASL